MNADVPRVFVSYTHETEAHKSWVRRLAEDLTNNGVKVRLDQWDLRVGEEIGAFMEKSVNEAEYILLVCTEAFAEKANQRKGGVGYEQAVLVGEILMNQELGSRFLPILRSGDPSKALPIYLRSRLFADFRDDASYPQALNQLLRRIFEAPEFTPPQLGRPPAFLAQDNRSNPVHRTVPPKAWILVAGRGTRSTRGLELDPKLQQTCITLGGSLARAGYGMVTGGWKGVDEVTSRSFARELEHLDLALEDRLVQVVVEDSVPAFAAGSLVLVRQGEEEWTESVKRAQAIVLIGGIGGTWSTGEYGLKLGRAVFPLADTGGDAARFYMHMLRLWKPEVLPGIERARFQTIAREAPQVVAPLVTLLDDWSKLRQDLAASRN